MIGNTDKYFAAAISLIRAGEVFLASVLRRLSRLIKCIRIRGLGRSFNRLVSQLIKAV